MKRAGFLLCFGVLIAGCSPIYYTPNSLNVPMIGKKGEGMIAAQFGDSSVDVQAAYSPAPKVGVLVDGFKVDHGQSHLLEAGAGYYQRLAERFLWDTYGIVGFGGVENHSSQGDVSGSFMRYGLQPSAGFRSRYFDAFLASRLVGLRYYNIGGNDVNEVQYLNNNAGTQFLFEPALTARVGYDFLKLQVQWGHSFNLTDSHFRQEEVILNFGVVYSFARK